jgi:Mlc titration factor MtfA (ptsG expression regulator)
VLSFFRKRRRGRVLGPGARSRIGSILARELDAWRTLNAAERDRLCDLSLVLIAEKRWEGCAGLELTEEMRAIIAAQAALLLLGFDLDPLAAPIYPNVQDVLVYPTGYFNTVKRRDALGVVHEGSPNLGEAWYGGPVIVSWEHAAHGARDGADGRNLVLHEFAHKLDMLDGVVDGTPPLPGAAAYTTWRQVMNDAFERLRSARPGASVLVLDRYGATSPAEFFAVATEAFFERSRELRDREPALYETLAMYYRQDTAARSAS